MHQGRRSFGRHSRAGVAWALGLFAAGQIVAGLLLDYRYPLTKFPSASIMLDAASQEPKPAVAFFGSSRTGAAIDIAETNKLLKSAHPNDPPRAINLSVPAGDAISAEFILDQLLSRGQKPRWAVIEVSPETVNSHNMWMIAHVMRQLNWEHVWSHFWTARRGKALWYYLEARTVPVYTHRKQLVKDAKSAARDWLPHTNGAEAQPAVPLDWKDVMRPPEQPTNEELLKLSRERASLTTRRWLTPYHAGGVTAEALERVLGRCRSEGIGVILLGIPACTAHRAEFTPAIEAEYTAYINRLTVDYGCRFVDARDWIPDTLFLDDMHLRFEDGAKVFTDRFVREVLVGLPME
jgi:Protein of unknown function (DUF1574)